MLWLLLALVFVVVFAVMTAENNSSQLLWRFTGRNDLINGERVPQSCNMVCGSVSAVCDPSAFRVYTLEEATEIVDNAVGISELDSEYFSQTNKEIYAEGDSGFDENANPRLFFTASNGVDRIIIYFNSGGIVSDPCGALTTGSDARLCPCR